MTMTVMQSIVMIGAVVLGTMTTRFLPFIIFPNTKEPPKYITYLGTVLPRAIIAFLVIYCLKDTLTTTRSDLLIKAVAIISIFLIHKWKRNTILSIATGTIIYMLLLHI